MGVSRSPWAVGIAVATRCFMRLRFVIYIVCIVRFAILCVLSKPFAVSCVRKDLLHVTIDISPKTFCQIGKNLFQILKYIKKHVLEKYF